MRVCIIGLSHRSATNWQRPDGQLCGYAALRDDHGSATDRTNYDGW